MMWVLNVMRCGECFHADSWFLIHWCSDSESESTFTILSHIWVESLYLNSVMLSTSRISRGIWFHLVWVLKKKFLAKAFELVWGVIELTKHKWSKWLFLSLDWPSNSCRYDGKLTGICCFTILKKKMRSKKSKRSLIGIIFSCLHFWMYVEGE